MFGIFVSVQFSCSDKWNKIFANRCNGFMEAISGTNSDICAVETEFNSSIFSINNTYLQVAIKQKDNLIGIKAKKIVCHSNSAGGYGYQMIEQKSMKCK